MDRPRTSNSFPERHTASRWGFAVRDGAPAQQPQQPQPASSPPSRKASIIQRSIRGGRKRSSMFVAAREDPTEPDDTEGEASGPGQAAARHSRKISSLFTRHRHSGSTSSVQTHSSSWLRRATSTTFKNARRPADLEVAGAAPPPSPTLEAEDSAAEGQPIQNFRLTGGDAARAAAAAATATREVVDVVRVPTYREICKQQDRGMNHDTESGIGIDMRDISECMDEYESMTRKDPATLPPEIFEHLLSFLDSTSLQQAELVSRKWWRSASAYPAWRDIFEQEYRHGPPASAPQEIRVGGLGIGKPLLEQNWKKMWKVRKALDARWADGHAAAIYLEGHKDSVYCVQFDEKKIITGSRDRTIRVWDAVTYECLKVLGVPKSSPPNVPSAPIGPRMNRQKPFTSMVPPRTRDEPAALMGPINHHGSILCLQFDEKTMVTGSSDTTLIIWDILDDYKPTHRLRRHTAGVLDVCFDAKHIVSCSKDTSICLWERESGRLLQKFSGHLGPVNAVQLRGEHIVSASGDGTARLWNLSTGTCVREFPSRDRGLACVEFSPDSRAILAGGNDHVIYQFDANTGELVREMQGHTDLVRSLHLDGRNARVISGSYDYSVKAFDARSGQLLCDFAGWTTSWMLSAKSDYRRIVATSQDGRVVVMDFGYGLDGVELLREDGE